MENPSISAFFFTSAGMGRCAKAVHDCTVSRVVDKTGEAFGATRACKMAFGAIMAYQMQTDFCISSSSIMYLPTYRQCFPPNFCGKWKSAVIEVEDAAKEVPKE